MNRMNRMNRGPAVLASLVAGVLALSLGTAGVAGAGVTKTIYTTDTAGYQVSGTHAYNDVRSTVTFEFITGATSQVNLLLKGASRAGPTAQLSLTFNGGFSNEWTLKWGYSATGAVPKLSTVIPLVLVTDAPTFVEIHYSTKTRQLVFLAGSEKSPTVVERVSGVRAQFTAPAIEVQNESANSLPIGARQAQFTRAGLTQLLNPASPGSPTKRLGLSAASLTDIWATSTGQPPTPDNPPTLVPSSLGAGSGFTVEATS